MTIANKTKTFMDVTAELLERGHRVRFRAEGGSMHPAIRGGDAIVVEKVVPAEIQTGEVVLYRTAERVIAHRVIGIDSGDDASPVFTVRGDAAGSVEEPVEPHQILGRVAAVERKARGARLRERLGTLLGFHARAAIAAVMVVVATLSAAPAHAAAKSWVGTTGGVWTTGTNWSPAGAPVAGDDVTIPADQTGDITNVPTITLGSLIINGTCDFESGPATGNTITVSSLFTVAGGETMSMGTVTNGRLEFVLAATATGTVAGTVDIQSGNNGPRTFTNNGDLTITAAGLITNTGALPSSFVNAAGATLRIGSAAGITNGGGGNIQTDNRTYSAAANYVYNGVANQNTGSGLPTNLTGSLTINNPGNTVTLSNARTIAGGGAVNIVAGTFAAPFGRLTMAANSRINRSGGSMTGTPQAGGAYDVFYTGNSMSTTSEVSGLSLRDVTVTLNADQTLTWVSTNTVDRNLSIATGSYFDLGANLTVSGTTTIAAGGYFDQGCTRTFTATGGINVSGGYLNCNSSTVGGSGNLTAGGITVNAGGSFDYVGAAAGTPTVTLNGNVVNNGIMRIWGGGRDGAGSPTCPAAPPTIVTATASQAWSGTGNFHLTNLSIDDQNATVPITAWNSTSVSGNTGSWTFTSGTCEYNSPTAVKVSSFAAAQTGKGVRISLKTSRDVNNLGFNLYREVNGQRVKLNASLLAGTALLGGAGTSFTAGQSRRWHDGGGRVGDVYWLEEVDLSGVKTWYGPVAAQGAPIAAKAMATDSGPSQTLMSASEPVVSAGAQDEELETALTLSRVGRLSTAADVNTSSAILKATMTAARPAPASQVVQKQYALAAGNAVRLGVNAEGWYRVTQPELVAAGMSPQANPKTLQLYANGIQQPILVETAANGTFGPQGAIYFYGMGVDTNWSDTQAYWLVAGRELGLRIGTVAAGTGTRRAASFPATVVWKPRTLYFAALLNGDGNNFFGPVVTDVPTSQDLTVNRLNATGGASKLQVKLQGATAGAHAVTLALNGTVLGQAHFNGQASVVATFAVPSLYEGANTLTFTAANQDDISVVDEVRLTYPRRYTAEGDALRFTVPAGSAATIDGFSAPSITAIDITNPANPLRVPGRVTGSAPNYALTLTPSGTGTRTLLAVASSGIRTPTVGANEPSNWHGPQVGYDMVIIGHASLLASAEPLADLRESQGLAVALVDVQDIYDEFNFGVKSPNALKTFLSTAKVNWTEKPRFVLLLGNGTFDPRDFLGTGVPDLVPAKLVDTGYLETASDDWFVDFNNDGIPDMAIGRLPAESAAAASLMVGKTVAYDQQSGTAWTARALMVTGGNQEPEDDFAGLTASVEAGLPAEISVTHAATGGDLIAGINAGQGLVNYIGHGSNEVWGGGLFDSSAALGLSNGPMTPVFLSMTCLNGYFQDIYTAPLGKALLSAPGGGAVAVWASSGLTDAGPQASMNQAMVKALYENPGMTIGQAAASAKSATTDKDVRRTWILLGDPSATLH